jgi:hypothetical protein
LFPVDLCVGPLAINAHGVMTAAGIWLRWPVDRAEAERKGLDRTFPGYLALAIALQGLVGGLDCPSCSSRTWPPAGLLMLDRRRDVRGLVALCICVKGGVGGEPPAMAGRLETRAGRRHDVVPTAGRR